MAHELKFHPKAERELADLDGVLADQILDKLAERLENPKVQADKLRRLKDCYKIKLKAAGIRLVYQVIDGELVVLVLGIGKRDRSKIYKSILGRMK